ncbi:short-chain dehydrogenase [Lentzea guizhouensis]|uniref:Short-chain dehydrogenase n=1 Tax=Lentzea guizhouensis TaxID=1586287 RepID=A0A1B2HMA2_9PSEU|nr:SDR family NAD(P)-dependent oxidoreductase [Lentzea guizhouensis]ANZ38836.1 short-chain dehydrogenase [Lentzea guizhouensis]
MDVLVTGGNKGLGLETVRQLATAGHTVWLGSRDLERGRVAAAEVGARAVQLDVTSDESVAAAVRMVGSLDVLVNNAGVSPERGPGWFVETADLTAEVLRETFETNVAGTVRVLHAFLPLLERSEAPVVVNVSSRLGSLSTVAAPGSPQHDYPGAAYPASKAALNMLTIQYAKAFPRMRINAVDPGFTATDLNDRTGTQSAAEGAAIIVRMAQVGPDGPTGGYFDGSGPLPW